MIARQHRGRRKIGMSKKKRWWQVSAALCEGVGGCCSTTDIQWLTLSLCWGRGNGETAQPRALEPDILGFKYPHSLLMSCVSLSKKPHFFEPQFTSL